MIKYNPRERRAIVFLVILLAVIRAVVSWSTAQASTPGEIVGAAIKGKSRDKKMAAFSGSVEAAENGCNQEKRTDVELPLDLNQATVRELCNIPGIAEGLAGRIVAYRRRYGHYGTLDELKRVPGMGENRVRRMKSSLVIGFSGKKREAAPSPSTVSPKDGRRVNINEAGFNDLCNLPGIGPVLARDIIRYRRQNGNFTGVEGLTDVPGIGPVKVELIRGLVVAISPILNEK